MRIIQIKSFSLHSDLFGLEPVAPTADEADEENVSNASEAPLPEIDPMGPDSSASDMDPMGPDRSEDEAMPVGPPIEDQPELIPISCPLLATWRGRVIRNCE